MIFSNTIFIIGLLPITILVYYLLVKRTKLKNTWLFLVSICFYAWGEPKLVILMIASILINYSLGLLVDHYRDYNMCKFILIFTVIYNIGLLFIFKYLVFAIKNLQYLGFHLSNYNIILPIGISFYTFQAMSYVIDVYKKEGDVQKNPLNVGLYITFFPQLIAGPIVRYETVAKQINYRKETIDDFSYGIIRFVCGFGKKIILANSFAVYANYAFDYKGDLSFLTAWLGALCYTFQIYFDFSGYSDMAVGLGKMFGFHFLENFNYPYISRSVSEFWRRWHISLGSWFRDYVYIPLGGSRVKRSRLILNLFIVWLLTGIWHGANWTFVFWGLWYFLLLTFEKITGYPSRFKSKVLKSLYTIFTLLSVITGWVLFRAESLSDACKFLKIMIGISGNNLIDNVGVFIFKDLWILLLIGIVISTPLIDIIGQKLQKKNNTIFQILQSIIIIFIFIISLSYSVNATYNPFIYFNF